MRTEGFIIETNLWHHRSAMRTESFIIETKLDYSLSISMRQLWRDRNLELII